MTEIAAHRGGAALWPENSGMAFRGALSLGVEQIEFDVQSSADGVPVIFHDAELDRVTNGTGPLAERTLAELKELQIYQGGGPIMTLEEGGAILAPSDIVLRCEIKPGPGLTPYPGLLEKVIATLGGMGLLQRTVITSFHLPTAGAAAAHPAPLRDVIWLVSEQIARLTSPAHVALLAAGEGVGAVSLHHRTLDAAALAILRDAGLRTGAFAVLEDAAIEWALRSDVTVFTTDRPDAALAIRERLKIHKLGHG